MDNQEARRLTKDTKETKDTKVMGASVSISSIVDNQEARRPDTKGRDYTEGKHLLTTQTRAR